MSDRQPAGEAMTSPARPAGSPAGTTVAEPSFDRSPLGRAQTHGSPSMPLTWGSHLDPTVPSEMTALSGSSALVTFKASDEAEPS